MLVRIVRWICLAVVRLFFRERAVIAAERIPNEGPLLVVANHPNGLMDPMLVWLALGRRVGFLAKSTLFENPIGKLAMDAFDAVPVYRARDGEDTSRNTRTFDICVERFGQGRAIVMFPEGVGHSEPKLKPLKTGAARIALAAQRAGVLPGELHILPVGLMYEEKRRFRSRVAVRVGSPIRVSDWREADAEDERRAARALTDEIARRLGSVVLQAENDELWRGFLAVARWTHPGAAEDVAACEAQAHRLSAAYHRLMAAEPRRAEALYEHSRHFVRMLKSVGVQNPFAVEIDEQPGAGAHLVATLHLLALAPFAALGALLGWVPYRLIGVLARKLTAREDDLESTVKALLGLVVMPLTYGLQAALVTAWLGWPFGIALLLVGPALGYLALRFSERFTYRKEAFRAMWLRWARRDHANAIVARRRELVQAVEAALAGYAEQPEKGADLSPSECRTSTA